MLIRLSLKVAVIMAFRMWTCGKEALKIEETFCILQLLQIVVPALLIVVRDFQIVVPVLQIDMAKVRCG